MKIKKKKLIVFAITLVISAAGIGTSYAIAVDAFNTNGDTEYWYDVAFTSVSTFDNEKDKDVADINAMIIDDNNIEITLTNSYPGYIGYVDFIITNTGDDPIVIDVLTISPYNTDALNVLVTDIIEGTILYVNGDTIEGQLTIEVLQGASQNTIYPVIIDIGFADHIE
jgi:hypothetical protein